MPGRDAVHVWIVDLHGDAADSEKVCLSSNEMQRAERFAFAKDRHRFIHCRAALRSILGEYLNQPPARLKFTCNRFGKPALDPASPLAFNVSHGDDLAVIAVTEGRNIGCDVEQVRPGIEIQSLARHFFSPHECTELLALPAERQLRAFFAVWTRKEAYIKARGEGLSLDLSRFAVSLSNDAKLLFSEYEENARRWHMLSFNPAPGFIAALAADGDPFTTVWQAFNRGARDALAV
jgi:4'-phosphopantetheinyl transferase